MDKMFIGAWSRDRTGCHIAWDWRSNGPYEIEKHYVGLTWVDGDKKGGFAMQCDKSDYRGVLAGLEGISGKKAVDSDALTVKN